VVAVAGRRRDSPGSQIVQKAFVSEVEVEFNELRVPKGAFRPRVQRDFR
jgi:hypothetical protein